VLKQRKLRRWKEEEKIFHGAGICKYCYTNKVNNVYVAWQLAFQLRRKNFSYFVFRGDIVPARRFVRKLIIILVSIMGFRAELLRGRKALCIMPLDLCT
jgi:hypothetical protein